MDELGFKEVNEGSKKSLFFRKIDTELLNSCDATLLQKLNSKYNIKNLSSENKCIIFMYLMEVMHILGIVEVISKCTPAYLLYLGDCANSSKKGQYSIKEGFPHKVKIISKDRFLHYMKDFFIPADLSDTHNIYNKFIYEIGWGVFYPKLYYVLKNENNSDGISKIKNLCGNSEITGDTDLTQYFQSLPLPLVAELVSNGSIIEYLGIPPGNGNKVPMIWGNRRMNKDRVDGVRPYIYNENVLSRIAPAIHDTVNSNVDEDEEFYKKSAGFGGEAPRHHDGSTYLSRNTQDERDFLGAGGGYVHASNAFISGGGIDKRPKKLPKPTEKNDDLRVIQEKLTDLKKFCDADIIRSLETKYRTNAQYSNLNRCLIMFYALEIMHYLRIVKIRDICDREYIRTVLDRCVSSSYTDTTARKIQVGDPCMIEVLDKDFFNYILKGYIIDDHNSVNTYDKFTKEIGWGIYRPDLYDIVKDTEVWGAFFKNSRKREDILRKYLKNLPFPITTPLVSNGSIVEFFGFNANLNKVWRNRQNEAKSRWKDIDTPDKSGVFFEVSFPSDIVDNSNAENTTKTLPEICSEDVARHVRDKLMADVQKDIAPVTATIELSSTLSGIITSRPPQQNPQITSQAVLMQNIVSTERKRRTREGALDDRDFQITINAEEAMKTVYSRILSLQLGRIRGWDKAYTCWVMCHDETRYWMDHIVESMLNLELGNLQKKSKSAPRTKVDVDRIRADIEKKLMLENTRLNKIHFERKIQGTLESPLDSFSLNPESTRAILSRYNSSVFREKSSIQIRDIMGVFFSLIPRDFKNLQSIAQEELSKPQYEILEKTWEFDIANIETYFRLNSLIDSIIYAPEYIQFYILKEKVILLTNILREMGCFASKELRLCAILIIRQKIDLLEGTLNEENEKKQKWTDTLHKLRTSGSYNESDSFDSIKIDKTYEMFKALSYTIALLKKSWGIVQIQSLFYVDIDTRDFLRIHALFTKELTPNIEEHTVMKRMNEKIRLLRAGKYNKHMFERKKTRYDDEKKDSDDDGESEHGDGESEHGDGESEHGDGESEHDDGKSEHDDGNSDHDDEILDEEEEEYLEKEDDEERGINDMDQADSKDETRDAVIRGLITINDDKRLKQNLIDRIVEKYEENVGGGVSSEIELIIREQLKYDIPVDNLNLILKIMETHQDKWALEEFEGAQRKHGMRGGFRIRFNGEASNDNHKLIISRILWLVPIQEMCIPKMMQYWIGNKEKLDRYQYNEKERRDFLWIKKHIHDFSGIHYPYICYTVQDINTTTFVCKVTMVSVKGSKKISLNHLLDSDSGKEAFSKYLENDIIDDKIKRILHQKWEAKFGKDQAVRSQRKVEQEIMNFKAFESDNYDVQDINNLHLAMLEKSAHSQENFFRTNLSATDFATYEYLCEQLKEEWKITEITQQTNSYSIVHLNIINASGSGSREVEIPLPILIVSIYLQLKTMYAFKIYAQAHIELFDRRRRINMDSWLVWLLGTYRNIIAKWEDEELPTIIFKQADSNNAWGWEDDSGIYSEEGLEMPEEYRNGNALLNQGDAPVPWKSTMANSDASDDGGGMEEDMLETGDDMEEEGTIPTDILHEAMIDAQPQIASRENISREEMRKTMFEKTMETIYGHTTSGRLEKKSLPFYNRGILENVLREQIKKMDDSDLDAIGEIMALTPARWQIKKMERGLIRRNGPILIIHVLVYPSEAPLHRKIHIKLNHLLWFIPIQQQGTTKLLNYYSGQEGDTRFNKDKLNFGANHLRDFEWLADLRTNARKAVFPSIDFHISKVNLNQGGTAVKDIYVKDLLGSNTSYNYNFNTFISEPMGKFSMERYIRDTKSGTKKIVEKEYTKALAVSRTKATDGATSSDSDEEDDDDDDSLGDMLPSLISDGVDRTVAHEKKQYGGKNLMQMHSSWVQGDISSQRTSGKRSFSSSPISSMASSPLSSRASSDGSEFEFVSRHGFGGR